MWLGRFLVIDLLVPPPAVMLFLPSWAVSAASQPLNSLAFLTDGVHWGTGDYRYLRNAMLIASGLGLIGAWILEREQIGGLILVWLLIGVWIALRGLFGLLRIFPGIGNSPFRT